MTYSRRKIALAPIWITLAIALAIVLAVGLATPKPAGAFIHEIVAALCNGGHGQGDFGEVEPPGQTPPRAHGESEVRALLATGFIDDVDVDVPANLVTITFDFGVPNSKYMDSGGDLFLAGAGGDGLDLLLSPLPAPDPAFPGHAHCFNLQP